MHRAIYDDRGLLTGSYTLKRYQDMVYTLTNGRCMADLPVGLVLAPERRIDIASLPRVVEATL